MGIGCLIDFLLVLRFFEDDEMLWFDGLILGLLIILVNFFWFVGFLVVFEEGFVFVLLVVLVLILV